MQTADYPFDSTLVLILLGYPVLHGGSQELILLPWWDQRAVVVLRVWWMTANTRFQVSIPRLYEFCQKVWVDQCQLHDQCHFARGIVEYRNWSTVLTHSMASLIGVKGSYVFWIASDTTIALLTPQSFTLCDDVDLVDRMLLTAWSWYMDSPSFFFSLLILGMFSFYLGVDVAWKLHNKLVLSARHSSALVHSSPNQNSICVWFSNLGLQGGFLQCHFSQIRKNASPFWP